MGRKINEVFLSEYIELDRDCCEKFGINTGGVTEYINRLNNARFAPGRDDVLPRLVRYRNMRNRLVHEKNASKVIDVSKKDINWINKFEKRLKKGRDPISTYLRNERIYKTWSRIRFIVIILLLAILGIAVFTLLKKMQII